MNEQPEIYVYLLNETVDVWRPVRAESLGDQRFRILSENADPENEEWQFSTGDVVRCERRMLSDAGPHRRLVAIERIAEKAEQ